MVETIGRLKKTSRRLMQELDRRPSEVEIASEMGTELDKVRQIILISQEQVSLEMPLVNSSCRYIQRVIGSQEPEPTDKEVYQDVIWEFFNNANLEDVYADDADDDERSTLSDFIDSEAFPDPFIGVSQDMLRDDINEAMSILTPRGQQILRMRYGLDGSQPKSLEEIGREFGVTRERIRQIEAKVLQKLRHPSNRRRLVGYI